MSIFNKKRYIAGISGGPDSIALLHMYKKYIKAVCTVKYNKRTDCEYDVECVKKLCAKYKIKHEILDVDDELYSKYNFENNFQNKARLIRYDFFNEIASKYFANKILIAHHLDDFLETAYLDFKKKSQKLYYGIKEVSFYNNTEIYRPLLFKYRKETLKRYCDDYKLSYAVDSTNDSDDYERNRVRKIIQIMNQNQIYDLYKKTLKYNKLNAKKEKEINSLFNEWRNNCFSIIFFKKIIDEYQFNLIFIYLETNNFFRPNRNKIENIISFIKSNKNGSFRLENNYKLIKNENFLSIVKDR